MAKVVQNLPAQLSAAPHLEKILVLRTLPETKVSLFYPVAAPEIVPEDVAEEVDAACDQSCHQPIFPEKVVK